MTLYILLFFFSMIPLPLKSTLFPYTTLFRSKWKNVLDNKWYGPDPILIRSRGAICVFPQNEDNPFWIDRKSTRLNSSHLGISYAVFCLKKKNSVAEFCFRNLSYCISAANLDC